MKPREGLRRIVDALDASGIPYMIAGSHASGLHGIVRMTHDFDIVIDTDEPHLRSLISRLSANGWHADERAALDGRSRGSMFNVIDEVTGWKTDLVPLGRDECSLTQWDRREPAEMYGIPVTVATAEDTILAKLRWAKLGGGSEVQLRDVAGIVAVQGKALDRSYIDAWVNRLGVADLWRSVLDGLPPV